MGQQMNIDSARFAQESLADNAQMVSAMKETAKTLKTQYKEINIDEVQVSIHTQPPFLHTLCFCFFVFVFVFVYFWEAKSQLVLFCIFPTKMK